MNLLPKKSWNVYNAKNKERVERDEREHKEKLEKERIRIQEIESEKRYKQMKDDLKKRKHEDDDNDEDEDDSNTTTTTTTSNTPTTNKESILNIFEGIENKIIMYNKNNDKKRNNNNNNEPINLNNITNAKLGEGSYEYKKEKPFWENIDNNNNEEESEKPKNNRKEIKKQKREQWVKDKEDPIHIVNKALGKERTTTITNTTTTTPSKPSTKKTIEQLRKERVEREQNERKKADLLINPTKSKSSSDYDGGDSSGGSTFSYLKYSGGVSYSSSKKR